MPLKFDSTERTRITEFIIHTISITVNLRAIQVEMSQCLLTVGYHIQAAVGGKAVAFRLTVRADHSGPMTVAGVQVAVLVGLNLTAELSIAILQRTKD